MTVSEFKAWLQGFGEAIEGSPTAEQWHKIKSRLGTVQESETVNLYERRPWWPGWYTYNTPNITLNPQWPVNVPSTEITWGTSSMAFNVGQLEAGEFSG